MSRVQKFDENDFLLKLSEQLKENSRLPNIKKYEPHEKQAVFHESAKKKKLYIGGNRSGKTTGGVTEGIWRATSRHPFRPELNALGPTRGRVIGVDFTQGVDKILLPQYKQWLYPSALRGGAWETAYDKSGRELTFANGSTIEFMSYDQDLDKFAGTSRHWIHFDEEPPESIYVENMARLIDTDGDFWMTMTPVEGMTWVYSELYEKNAGNPDGKVEVIEINTNQNPYLSKTAIESFEDSIDDGERQSRIEGKFVQQGGRIYKNFDPTTGGPHVLPSAVSNPALFFKDWLWICSLDHGLNNPTAVLWTAADKNGFAITFDEHYQAELTVEQHAAIINAKTKLHGRPADLYVADPAITQRNGITKTSIQVEYQRYGISWTLGNNDVGAGIVRVKRYFNKTKYIGRRLHPAFVIDESPEIDVFPRLRITPNCTQLIGELKFYRWKTYSNKKLTYENNAYDEPHKKNDHACDSLRYALMTQPDLFAQNESEIGKDFKSKLDAAMEGMGYGPENDHFLGVNNQVEFADPWDRGGAPISSGDGDWQFDEHLGGIY